MKGIIAKFASAGFLISLALHASAGTTFFVWQKISHSSGVQEFELASISSQSKKGSGQRGSVEADDWFLIAAKKKRAVKEPVKQVSSSPCTDCDESSTDDFISSNDARKKPRWVGNFITPRDYPSMAREQGKDGRVVLSVIINEDGRVRSVELLEGSYEPLNAVALVKVKNAVFSPAYDTSGHAVACRVKLPIRFSLK